MSLHEHIRHIDDVIESSKKTGNKLVDLKERLLKRNSREEFIYQAIKSGKETSFNFGSEKDNGKDNTP